MGFFDYFKTRVNAPSKSKHVYSPNHILTHDFGVVTPVFRKYLVPGDDFTIDCTQFTRLMPMPCPTFGVVKSINRAFFVPLEYVMTNFDQFLKGDYTASSNLNRPDLLRTPAVPVVNMQTIVLLLAGTSVEVTINDKWDISFKDENSVVHYYRFDWIARKRFSFLTSLGLNICREWKNGDQLDVCVLPILAFWKFYIDYVVPVKYRHNWTQYESLFTDYDTNNCRLEQSTVLELLFKVPTAWLSPDYFNSAFENPFGLDYNRPSPDSISNPALYSGDSNYFDSVSEAPVTGGSRAGGAHVQSQVTSSKNAINAFTIRSLGVLQDMINKNRITDVKIREWLLATYGISPNNDSLHLSTYLGSSDNDILIGDIMATAKTEVEGDITHVGQYAGKGLGGQNHQWKYSSEHHGYLFVTNELVARTSYIQGLDPDFRYFDKRQFFLPELDNFGVTAIEKSEIGIDVGVGSDAGDFEGVFGFKPNYAEMKKMSDIVSGDFRVPSLNTGLDSWYLSRLIDNSNWARFNFVSEGLSRALEDGIYNNYDRIFQSSSSDADHFYSVFRFNVHAMRPMISVTEIFETEETGNGREITIDKQI